MVLYFITPLDKPCDDYNVTAAQKYFGVFLSMHSGCVVLKSPQSDVNFSFL